MLHQGFEWRGRAKRSHADALAICANILGPAKNRGLFDRNSRRNIWWKDAIAIFLGLIIKKFPRGHADNARAGSLTLELFKCLQAKGDFTARGHQQNFRAAGRRISEHIRTASQTEG